VIIKNKYQLKRHLHYNPHTGVFTRVQQPRTGTLCIGKITNDCLVRKRSIKILGVYYRATHLAYLYMTGTLPDGQIDHVNQDTTDFRWSNLRLVASSCEEGVAEPDAANVIREEVMGSTGK
jgi:hypothetical protein